MGGVTCADEDIGVGDESGGLAVQTLGEREGLSAGYHHLGEATLCRREILAMCPPVVI